MLASVCHNPYQDTYSIRYTCDGELVDEAGPFPDELDAVDAARRSGGEVDVGGFVGNSYEGAESSLHMGERLL